MSQVHPITLSFPISCPSKYCTSSNTVSLQIQYHSKYRVPPNIFPLPILCPSEYFTSPNTVSLQILYLSNYSVPPNTAPLPKQYLSQNSTSPKTVPLPKQHLSQNSTSPKTISLPKQHLSQNSTSLIIPYLWIHLNTVPLSKIPYPSPIPCPFNYCTSPNFVSLQIQYLLQFRIPPNTVFLSIQCPSK